MTYVLRVTQPDALTDLLHVGAVLDADDHVTRLASAGDGNMNLTLRATTARGATLIVKQARPWVQKYPQIPAPEGRTEVEAAFYATVAPHPSVSAAMPKVLLHRPDHHLLVLSDLGIGGDFSDIYGEAQLPGAALEQLLRWLDALHRLDVDATPTLANHAMRRLNHEHIYDLPFRKDANLGLDGVLPGLAELASEVAADGRLLDRVHALGEAYLEDGPTLLHGDFYPGSWLRSDQGPMVIDPEFAYLGDRAFDHGVLAAHLVMSDHPRLAEIVLARTPSARPHAGVEILRRLLGVAQLPLRASLTTRRQWVHLARGWVANR